MNEETVLSACSLWVQARRSFMCDPPTHSFTDVHLQAQLFHPELAEVLLHKDSSCKFFILRKIGFYIYSLVSRWRRDLVIYTSSYGYRSWHTALMLLVYSLAMFSIFRCFAKLWRYTNERNVKISATVEIGHWNDVLLNWTSVIEFA